ncbi:MAG: AEC family transporter [Clostridia bacterium]|nr:AEC family transporter [Clostridia bacterium]
MENLVTSFEAVLPLFLMIMLGMFLRRIGMLEEKVRQSLNKLCFKVFLPIYLFNNIYEIEDISKAFDLRLILFACIGLVAAFCVMMALVPRFEKKNSRRGVMIQAMFRSNFALFGLPLAETLCTKEFIGPTSLLLGLTVPIFNILAVISLETFRGGKPSVKKMLRGIAANPLIIASLLGIAFYCLKTYAGFILPTSLHKGTLVKLGNVATPLSLVALGSQFVFSSVKNFKWQLFFTVLVRLVVLPLVMVSIAVMLGLRNEFLVPIMIMYGAPTAVSSYPMAQQMGGDGDLAASCVVFTSGFAILTIFLFIFGLKSMGLIL